ncbi:MAG TPA: MerR family transcriptional regulator [Gammaproteobacteria bacterium]|nr:MerR family transcriptional regulator [Gammaproteobacteria bacterium]
MSKESLEIFTGTLVDDDSTFTLADLCRSCSVHAETITQMVDYGIVEPAGDNPARWRFAGSSLRRVTTVVRLQRDLGVNLAGAALALDLLDEIRSLRERLPAAPAHGDQPDQGAADSGKQ